MPGLSFYLKSFYCLMTNLQILITLVKYLKRNTWKNIICSKKQINLWEWIIQSGKLINLKEIRYSWKLCKCAYWWSSGNDQKNNVFSFSFWNPMIQVIHFLFHSLSYITMSCKFKSYMKWLWFAEFYDDPQVDTFLHNLLHCMWVEHMNMMNHHPHDYITLQVAKGI